MESVLFRTNFNSLPHAEVDPPFGCLTVDSGNFNSLPHAEVDATPFAKPPISSLFQLTTSRRGRRNHYSYNWNSGVFQLTTSRRGRRCFMKAFGLNKAFQLTTSRRGRRYAETSYTDEKNFNSLPHAEVDSNLSQNLWTLTIDSITNRIINLCFLL